MVSAAPAAWAAPGDVPATQGFRKAVTLAGIREHQAAWQAIADANGGNRAAGTSGYDASAEYVAKQMAAAAMRCASRSSPLASSGRRGRRSWRG
jgi:hypothetical protein